MPTRVVMYPPVLERYAPQIKEQVGQPNDLDHLLRELDFIVLAVPLNDDTRSMIGPRVLGLLKPNAFLINPARAELVDEQAIYQALRLRAFADAALDPWWHYPKTDECVAPSRYPFVSFRGARQRDHDAPHLRKHDRNLRATHASRRDESESLLARRAGSERRQGALSRHRRYAVIHFVRVRRLQAALHARRGRRLQPCS